MLHKPHISTCSQASYKIDFIFQDHVPISTYILCIILINVVASCSYQNIYFLYTKMHQTKENYEMECNLNLLSVHRSLEY